MTMHNNKRRHNGGMNGGGQHRQHNNNRPRRFGSNNGGRSHSNGGGMDDPANVARTRRNAVQQKEKYQMMARDALSMGDRVLAESHLQHADHYHRVLLSLPPEEAPRPQYLRGHEPGAQNDANGNPATQNADGQHTEQQQHQHPSSSEPETHALPSFITQPLASEGHE